MLKYEKLNFQTFNSNSTNDDDDDDGDESNNNNKDVFNFFFHFSLVVIQSGSFSCLDNQKLKSLCVMSLKHMTNYRTFFISLECSK